MKKKPKLIVALAEGMAFTYKHKSAVLWVTRPRQPDNQRLAFQPIRTLHRSDMWYGSRTCSIHQRAIQTGGLKVGRMTSARKRCPGRTYKELLSISSRKFDGNGLPAGLSINSQTFCPWKACSRKARVTMILHSRIQIKGCLFGQSRMTRVFNGRGHQTVDVLLASRLRSTPMTYNFVN